jgi:uncharacterized damage-inducible protein DinB
VMSPLSYYRSHWVAVRSALLETIDKFLEDELDYKPFADSRSVAQLMLHIAHEENIEFNYGIAQTLSELPSEYDPQSYPTKAAIKSLLALVHAPAVEYLSRLDEAALDQVIATPWGASQPLIEMLGHLIEHEIHHRGELSLILGMLGRTGLDA